MERMKVLGSFLEDGGRKNLGEKWTGHTSSGGTTFSWVCPSTSPLGILCQMACSLALGTFVGHDADVARPLKWLFLSQVCTSGT